MSPSLPLLGTSTAGSGQIAIASHASAPVVTQVQNLQAMATGILRS